ncbi:MAG: sugar transferase [Endomicrobia bacterium]|nr:sugar transferase [Endomicrobiia bacterium]
MNLGTPKTTLFSSLSIFYLAAYFTRKQFLSFKDKRGLLVKKIVIIGVSSTINEIKQNLLNNKEYKVIFEYASLDEQKGNIENYTKKNIDFIVIQNGYLFNRDTAFWKPLAKNFVNKGITIKTDFDFYEELFGRIPDESVKESLWLIKTIAERDEYGVYKILKRSIDILVSLLAVLLFFIPFLFIWLVIKIVDGYNPVFKQKRIGYLGKTFYIYKFRTMKQKKNDTAAKEVFNEYNKEQSEYGVTGKILRRFRLDEIPQLINLIKGDLSLVGPRPVWDKEYETAEKQISNYSLRNIVRPGIAGWAQLNFRAVRNIEDCVIRFAYDIYYIKNKSFFLDISIILKTIRRLFISDKKMG